MYNVENKSDIYVYELITRGSNRIHALKKLGGEKDLVIYIAEGFRELPVVFENGEPLLKNSRFEFEYFDGYNRRYDPYSYYDDAYDFYVNHIKTSKHFVPKYHWKWRDRYKYKFREGNVECIRKIRGGPSVRPRRVKAARAPYLDPEQRPYLRGSISDYPMGWWDDFDRCVERNWKSQRKTRHQYKTKTE